MLVSHFTLLLPEGLYSGENSFTKTINTDLGDRADLEQRDLREISLPVNIANSGNITIRN